MTAEFPSIVLSHVKMEDVLVASHVGLDTQGVPTYATPVTIQARVKVEDKFMTDSDGSRIQTTLTLWFGSTAPVIAQRQDRVTWKGKNVIVVEHKEVRTLEGTVSHHRIRCRDE